MTNRFHPTSRAQPLVGVTGQHQGNWVSIEINLDQEHQALVAPGDQQYLPCIESGRVFTVPLDVDEVECTDCVRALDLSEQDLVAVLRDKGPQLLCELVDALRKRCGSRYLTRHRVRELFWQAQDRFGEAITAHKVENDDTELYLVLKKGGPDDQHPTG